MVQYRGDPGAQTPFVLVDPQQQRDALEFVTDILFNDDFFDISPEVLNHLAPSRWWHDGSSVSFSMDFPMYDYISTIQWWTLLDRFFPNTLRRIHDAELKTDADDKFTIAEYFQKLKAGCWSDALDHDRLQNGTWTDSKPYISSVRRSLQREYLTLVEILVRYKPGTMLSPDVHAMLQCSIRDLSGELQQALQGDNNLDFASRAHLESCKSRIDRILTPELSEIERRY